MKDTDIFDTKDRFYELEIEKLESFLDKDFPTARQEPHETSVDFVIRTLSTIKSTIPPVIQAAQLALKPIYQLAKESGLYTEAEQ